jgi:sulfofructose kinase
MEPTDRSNSSKALCVGLGLCALDYTFVVDPYPKSDDKIDALAFSRQGGGPVPTALCTLARFGISTSFIGKCGADLDGQVVQDELEQFGVNTESLILDSNSRTPRAFILVDKSTGKRTVVLDRTMISPMLAADINPELLKDAKYLLIDGREIKPTLMAAKLVIESGGEIILDAGSMRARMDEILQYVNHLLVSSKFAREFTGESDSEKAAFKLASRGFKSTVITLGDEGCIGLSNNGMLIRQKAFKVNVTDTTGAGDVFHGAFIYGLIQKWELKGIMEFASAAAALKCTRLGGRGIPTLDEVRELINSN